MLTRYLRLLALHQRAARVQGQVQNRARGAGVPDGLPVRAWHVDGHVSLAASYRPLGLRMLTLLTDNMLAILTYADFQFVHGMRTGMCVLLPLIELEVCCVC